MRSAISVSCIIMGREGPKTSRGRGSYTSWQLLKELQVRWSISVTCTPKARALSKI